MASTKVVLASLALLSPGAILACSGTPAATNSAQTLAPGPPADLSLCGPEIDHWHAVRNAPMVLLGEVHGLTAPPSFGVDLACRIAMAGKHVQLALEIPAEEQPRIDAFLASSGMPNDRDALIHGAFWTREYQDGRSSEARVGMLDAVRKLRKRGVPLRVVAIDEEHPDGKNRDSNMAKAVLAARRPDETTVLLIGNLHIHTVPGAPWDSKVEWAGVDLRAKEPGLIALDNRYAPGSAWICTGSDATGCGVHSVGGKGTAARWAIGLFDSRDEDGVDGFFDIGPAVPSQPASAVDSPAPVTPR
jgi:hypothetical protein